jgi:hypothetical protein
VECRPGQEWNEKISGDWGGQMDDYLSIMDDVSKAM